MNKPLDGAPDTTPESVPEAPAAQPSTPKSCHTTLHYEDLTAELQALAASNPTFAELCSLGKSHEGRDVWMMAIGDRSTFVPSQNSGKQDRDERPALYVDANIHAMELTGSTACFRLIHDLLAKAATPEGQKLLREVTFYIVPRVSPDGAEHFLRTGEVLRSAPRLYPREEWPEGLHMKDLDGDGKVYQMRILSPDGDHRISKEDPRIMVHRTFLDTEGPFYYLLPEGMIHDYDGHVVSRGANPYGLDYNRNFPNAWRQDVDQAGAGRTPLSEPETRAVADFILRHPTIGLFLALHTGIEVLIPPEGARPFSEFPEADRITLTQLGNPGAEVLKMPFESLFPVDYGKIHGDFGEWLYEQQGILGFVAELWCPAARAGVSLKDYIHSRMGLKSAEPFDLAIARWLDANGLSDELRPWKTFEHPQLGTVELGGYRQGGFSQAPDGVLLEAIGEQLSRYAQQLALALPRIRAREISVKEEQPGLFRVGITVVNGGFLPSHLSRAALLKKVARPVMARLILPDGCIRLSGKEKVELGHLGGYGDHQHAEWLVKAPAGTTLELELDAHRAGRTTFAVELV